VHQAQFRRAGPAADHPDHPDQAFRGVAPQAAAAEQEDLAAVFHPSAALVEPPRYRQGAAEAAEAARAMRI